MAAWTVGLDGTGSAELPYDLDRLESLFRAAPLGIGIVRPDGRVLVSNHTLRGLLGFSADEFEAMQWTEYTHPDDVGRNVELFRSMAAGERDSFTIEKRFIRKDGSTMWAELTSSLVRDADGAPGYVIGMVQDIGDRKQLEQELRAAEKQYRLLVERVPAVVYVADAGPDGRWHYVSPQIEQMLGFSAGEWMADPTAWLRQVHPEDREEVLAAESWPVAAGSGAEVQSGSYRMLHRDGRVVWVRDDAIAERVDERLVWHGVLVDVTREKQLEERLGHQAFHDALTGMPNRTHFQEQVDQAIERAEGEVAVCFVDLDEFKTINDTFGHSYGDRVIVAAAQRIRRCLPAGAVAARFGGDEFGLLLEGPAVAEADDLAATVLGAIRGAPMRLGDLTVTVGASIGVAVATPGDSSSTLLRNADLAMYQAKQDGRGRHRRYHAGLHDEVVLRYRVEEALQSAVHDGRVGLVYQPIVETGTGVVAGLEALARWEDPDLGTVSPAQFIPVAERTGLIRELGSRLIREACHALVGWRRRTGGTAYVSVNVSPRQLDDTFPEVVAEALRGSGLPPSALVLEVTEGLLLAEPHRISIRDLRALGVRVAVDDFGTGYSSLSYLRELPVDMIKVDQVFLRPDPHCPDGGGSHTLLRAVVQLCQSLRLTTICEGVETADQLALLGKIDCGYAQGYLLGRPGPLASIPARLSAAAMMEG